jgi:hypothetical protein
MTWDFSVKLTDLAIMLATLIGPIAALRIQKRLERLGATEARQVNVFRTLMLTRASGLSPAHVEALNAIPMEFYKVRPVITAWKTYLDHLGRDTAASSWGENRVRLLTDLLYQMAQQLNYDFERLDIEKDVYWPTGHSEIESDQTAIRKGLAALLSGRVAFPMEVKQFPADLEMRSLIMNWLQSQVNNHTDPSSELK